MSNDLIELGVLPWGPEAKAMKRDGQVVVNEKNSGGPERFYRTLDNLLVERSPDLRQNGHFILRLAFPSDVQQYVKDEPFRIEESYEAAIVRACTNPAGCDSLDFFVNPIATYFEAVALETRSLGSKDIPAAIPPAFFHYAQRWVQACPPSLLRQASTFIDEVFRLASVSKAISAESYVTENSAEEWMSQQAEEWELQTVESQPLSMFEPPRKSGFPKPPLHLLNMSIGVKPGSVRRVGDKWEFEPDLSGPAQQLRRFSGGLISPGFSKILRTSLEQVEARLADLKRQIQEQTSSETSIRFASVQGEAWSDPSHFAIVCQSLGKAERDELLNATALTFVLLNNQLCDITSMADCKSKDTEELKKALSTLCANRLPRPLNSIFNAAFATHCRLSSSFLDAQLERIRQHSFSPSGSQILSIWLLVKGISQADAARFIDRACANEDYSQRKQLPRVYGWLKKDSPRVFAKLQEIGKSVDCSGLSQALEAIVSDRSDTKQRM